MICICLMVLSFNSLAQTFPVDGLTYEVISTNPNEVRLTGGTPPTSDLVIPDLVSDGVDSFAVVALGNTAFENAGLTSVSFPNTLRELGQITFRFNALTNVVIPEGITVIPQRCFSNNDLTSVTLPSTLERIGFRAFERNEIESITIPEGVTEIQGFAFDLNNLSELTIPENVTSIGSDAFIRNNLNSITSEALVPPFIQENSFGDRNAIDLIVPPTAVNDYLDGQWTGFASYNGEVILTVGNTIEIEGFMYTVISFEPNEVEAAGGIAIPSNLVLPESVNIDSATFTVAGIGIRAFENKNLTSVQLPNTIRYIDDFAFQNNQISNISIPTSVTSINFRAFRLNQIQTLVMPNSVTSVGNGAFENNILTDLSLSENLTAIEQFAFNSNELTSITIPASINSLGDQCFQNNPLTEVIVLNTTPPSISGGPDDPFRDSRENIDLSVPDGTAEAYIDAGWTGFNSILELPLEVGVTFLINNVDYTIVSLAPNEVEASGSGAIPADLVLPEFITLPGDEIFQLVSIGDQALQNKQLNTVTIPDSVTNIGNGAFSLNLLTSITIPDSVTSMDVGAFSSNQLTSVIISSSLTNIPNGAFINNQLISVTIPESVTNIGTAAFLNNQLTSITIPNSITSIDAVAFSNNPLETITSFAVNPPSISANTFGERSTIDLFIPEGSTQDYENAMWTGFNTVTETTMDITVAPKVFLQGASLNPIAGEEDLMRDSLRESDLLPTTSPYGDGATVDPIVFNTTGSDAIVDWVFVELRSGADNENTTVVASQSALLQRDGDIVGVDGTASITFTEEADDYFIAVKHRNHIGILAAVPAPLSSTASTLDFTQDAAFVKGENLALTEVNGTFAMIAGDADGSSQILNTDITEALTLAGGGESYSTADADMNGFVLNSDIQLLVLSNSGTVQQFE